MPETENTRTLPTNWDDVETLINERTQQLIDEKDAIDETMQIMHALEAPIVRINPDNTMRFFNNAFMDFAEFEEIDRQDIAQFSNKYRPIYEGSDFTAFLTEEDRLLFEQVKESAKKKYWDDRTLTFKLSVNVEVTFVTKQANQVVCRASVSYSGKFDAWQILLFDLTELKASETQLQQAHDEMARRVEDATAEIREQSSAIMEMSTPVINLWRHMVLLPLVGMLDSARSSQMIETLLQTIVDEEAKVAVIDVTGVPMIDTSVARHLLKTVDAASMLGAEVIITGFSPVAAQTLAQLGVDFSTLRTSGSLRTGIVQALDILGVHVSE
jgi:anti-anti-sigma regulatory factor